MEKIANLLVLLVSLSMFSQASPVFASKLPDKAKLTAAQSSIVATNDLSNPEIALLREQVKVMKDYHGSLLDTVYLALGGVFTMAVLLSGFAWWSNFKLLDGDKRRLQEDMTGRISELEAKLGQQTAELESDILLKNNAFRLEIERTVDAKSEAHLSRLSSETGDVRTQLTSVVQQVNDLTKDWLKTQNEVKNKFAEVKKEFSRSAADLRLAEENIWELKEIPANILLTQVQGLNAVVESNPDLIKLFLSRMKETIEKGFLISDKSLKNNELSLIKGSLSVVSQVNPIETAEVQDLLSKIKIKD